MCFNKTAPSCFVALSFSQKAYCCHGVPNQWGLWSKTGSKFLNKQHQWQSSTICVTKITEKPPQWIRQNLNVVSSPSFSNHVWQMSQSSLVSLTAWHLHASLSSNLCRSVPSFWTSCKILQFHRVLGLQIAPNRREMHHQLQSVPRFWASKHAKPWKQLQYLLSWDFGSENISQFLANPLWFWWNMGPGQHM